MRKDLDGMVLIHLELSLRQQEKQGMKELLHCSSMKMTRCVYRNDAMNYSTEPDMHTRKLNIVKKPDTQEKDANKGSRTGFGIDFHHVSLSTIVKKAIKMSMSGQVLDASKLVNQRSIEKEVNSKYGGTPMGTPNSRFDDTPMGTPMSTTNNRQVRNKFQVDSSWFQVSSQ